MKRILIALAMLQVSVANAEITDFLSQLNNYQYTFAVYDIRPANFPLSTLEEALTTAVRTYSKTANISRAIPPQILPNGAPRMILQKVSRRGYDRYKPQCYGEIFSINSLDTFLERTGAEACIFPYKDGYRVNYYGQYIQAAGTESAEHIRGSIDRFIFHDIGLGDPSKFMKATLDKFEKEILVAGAKVELVELFPAMQGKIAVEDPAPKMSASEQALVLKRFRELQPMSNGLPSQLQAIFANNPEIQAALASQGRSGVQIQARKNLQDMGLTYHNQDQFVDAIKRSDVMAVELFLKAGAVDANKPTSDGSTLLSLATQRDIIGMLTSKTSRK